MYVMPRVCVKNPQFSYIKHVYYSCHLVERGIMSTMEFAMTVAHALSQIGKTGIMLKSEQDKLYITHTKGEMCFCGYQPSLASPLTTKSYPFFLSLSTTC